MTLGLLLEPLCEPKHGCKQKPVPLRCQQVNVQLCLEGAEHLQARCGRSALSAWFETNRQFPSQPSESNLN